MKVTFILESDAFWDKSIHLLVSFEIGLTEGDLQKLQRQYRMLEADRKAYSDESRLILHKQK